ncbi:MAG: hypothetical protein QOG17_3544 [Gammaproteobacteria bacterium]|jgi:ElaB/YqjD/DUF883 family membrane-anchored ribosome-binding protein|nr:hypothetical protein [Gammaproteobacteria bacterium]
MEKFEGTADEVRASGRRVGEDISGGGSNIKNVASAEIKNLIADVEDLVARIADLKDADVARVRNRVLRAVGSAKESLASAKESLVDSADNLRRQAQRAATTADDYVHDSPWQAVGIAALVGALVGILATRRS